MNTKTSPAAVSAAIRKAGIATLPSGSPLNAEGVRVSKFMTGAVVTVNGPGRETVRRCAAEALVNAGYAVEASKSGDSLFVSGRVGP